MSTYSFDTSKKQVSIQLYKKNMEINDYVAMAFSNDKNMGEDLVFSCTNAASPVRIGWNKGRSGPSALPKGVEIQSTSYVNDKEDFICNFVLNETIKFVVPGSHQNEVGQNEVIFDLGEEDYFILLADGPKGIGGIPGYHRNRDASVNKISFKSFTSNSSAPDTENRKGMSYL